MDHHDHQDRTSQQANNKNALKREYFFHKTCPVLYSTGQVFGSRSLDDLTMHSKGTFGCNRGPSLPGDCGPVAVPVPLEGRRRRILRRRAGGPPRVGDPGVGQRVLGDLGPDEALGALEVRTPLVRVGEGPVGLLDDPEGVAPGVVPVLGLLLDAPVIIIFIDYCYWLLYVCYCYCLLIFLAVIVDYYF